MITSTVLLFGMLFGLQHALEADHLAAVATLVAPDHDRRRVIRQGVFWGLGHSLTLLLFGGAVMVVGIVLSDAWTHALEAAVGVLLVLLGADLLRRLWQRGEAHPHAVGQHCHHHQSVPLRALLIGMVHGLAGSAALALLTLHQIGSPLLGLLYILLFGFGSVIGMAALSWAVSVPMRIGARHLTRCHRVMNIGVALFSVGLGLFVVASQWPI